LNDEVKMSHLKFFSFFLKDYPSKKGAKEGTLINVTAIYPELTVVGVQEGQEFHSRKIVNFLFSCQRNEGN